jgi:biopolymer transport protein ExbB
VTFRIILKSAAVGLLLLAMPLSASHGQQSPKGPAAPIAAADQPAAAGQPRAVTQPGSAADAARPSLESSRDLSKSGSNSVPHDLSPWSMFLGADLVVKAVMIGLFFASLVTWTVLITKTIELAQVQRKLKSSLARISRARSLTEADEQVRGDRGVQRLLVEAALRELRLSARTLHEDGIKERVASTFAEIVRAEARRVRVGLGLLATIGATAPFVGLFGTVWGIMDSFIGISKSQTTNLAVVAPGIAEALLTTAIGLAAAIPAVIIYNHLTRVSKGYLETVMRTSGAVGRVLSRDIEGYSTSVLSRAAE